ncbi:uncharacterized protein PHALS_14481 [Plasmopara halstedii]|uniref:Uncharacterized protein n=1 Tax=Plasmopara halstedii TaxID=4781 RepID=A0A0P1ASN2_PLAHL|nr:uncharacterized protein PHALS_14481 [Plasmopara halstedii]CEG44222.1 hypothetical protein PHALS_14481 [Plasmopara halstedii]|eukprot:XP_024580591.1 hypothetical protein PHALS_14481 [Plasmopara halstedii]
MSPLAHARRSPIWWLKIGASKPEGNSGMVTCARRAAKVVANVLKDGLKNSGAD